MMQKHKALAAAIAGLGTAIAIDLSPWSPGLGVRLAIYALAGLIALGAYAGVMYQLKPGRNGSV